MDAKEQIEGLMNELLPFAEKMLSEHGGFHPFGGYLSASAKVVHVGVEPDAEHATAPGRVEMLIGSLKQLVGQKKAIGVGIATDVTLENEDGTKADAIKLFLEHRSGYCAEVFFRYELENGVVAIIDTTAQRGDSIFW